MANLVDAAAGRELAKEVVRLQNLVVDALNRHNALRTNHLNKPADEQARVLAAIDDAGYSSAEIIAMSNAMVSVLTAATTAGLVVKPMPFANQ